mmetsp:Transcript_14006/g.32624  ORF Transcript_14006/g.32624 Transcript_14006/m.32624 type:complete len:597 (-) Transcript_14006:259-2049(-)
MADEDDYGDENEDYGEGGDEGDYGSEFEASPTKPAQPPTDATMMSKETASTGALQMEMQQMAEAHEAEVEAMKRKLAEAQQQLKAFEGGDNPVAKERDKLRYRLDTFEKKAKEELTAAVESARAYEDTKRLVDAKQSNVELSKDKLDLEAKYRALSQDCDTTRASLLSDLGMGRVRLDPATNPGAVEWAKGTGQKGKAHMAGVKDEHSTLVGQAKGNKKIGERAKSYEEGGNWSTVDEKNYQFVSIMELVRLRVQKAEMAAQSQIESAVKANKTQSTLSATGLISATMTRDMNAGADDASAAALGLEGMDGAATVARLEQQLEAMKKANSKLENKCGHLENQLQEALGASDDLTLLKAKAMSLLERQKNEKELRLRAEAATKASNKKVLALSQHIEKLMLHLKHEAASKAKAHEAAGRAAQEVSLLRARNAALGKRAASRDSIIKELTEGAKILEDQLRLMDEKYMELRTKLDFTRMTTGKEVTKYKALASSLRAKWAAYSNNQGLLDELEMPQQSPTGSQTGSWAGSATGQQYPETDGNNTAPTSGSVGGGRRKGGGKKSRAGTSEQRSVTANPAAAGRAGTGTMRPASSMPSLS